MGMPKLLRKPVAPSRPIDYRFGFFDHYIFHWVRKMKISVEMFCWRHDLCGKWRLNIDWGIGCDERDNIGIERGVLKNATVGVTVVF